jgi:hypothetical protein
VRKRLDQEQRGEESMGGGRGWMMYRKEAERGGAGTGSSKYLRIESYWL